MLSLGQLWPNRLCLLFFYSVQPLCVKLLSLMFLPTRSLEETLSVCLLGRILNRVCLRIDLCELAVLDIYITNQPPSLLIGTEHPIQHKAIPQPPIM